MSKQHHDFDAHLIEDLIIALDAYATARIDEALDPLNTPKVVTAFKRLNALRNIFVAIFEPPNYDG